MARPAGAVMGVVVCWIAAYLVLMNALGLSEAGLPVILAAIVRGVGLPVAALAGVAVLSGRRWRTAAMAVATGFHGVVLGAHLVYAGYFQVPPTLATLRHLGEVPEVLPQVVYQLLSWRVMAVAILLVAGFVIWRLRLSEIELAPRRAVAVVFGVVVLLIVQQQAAHAAYDRWGPVPADRLRVYSMADAALRFGIADLWVGDVVSMSEHRRHPVVAEWPGPVEPDPRDHSSRRPSGWNLVTVQLESVDPWAMAAEIAGVPVMPYLRILEDRAVVFDSVFAQHSGGGSSDAELATMLSLLPMATHSGLLTMDASCIRSLPKYLTAQGYNLAAMHPNRGSYFNRTVVYPRLGFHRFLDIDDFRGEARGWNASDAAFFTQAVEHLERMPEPFFTSLISIQSHGPFRNHPGHPEADPGAEFPRLERDYLQCMREVDRGIEVFFNRLEASGLADRTLVLLYSDHASQVRDTRVHGREPIVCLAVAPGLDARRVTRVGSHLDLAPTAVELLGLSAAEGWIGTSLLAPGEGTALFNDLSELRRVGGRLESRRAEGRMPWLLYSAAVLDG